jgi:tetratricopeptide (TPR) repeat protein
VALLFAIHPLRVESVVWASERKDVLSVLFYLLTIVFYSEWTRSPDRWRWYGLALASAGLGILSKPSLMTLPGILLLVDVWPLGRLGWQDRTNLALLRRIVLEKVPFLLLALAAAAVAWLTWSGRQILVEAADLTWIERIGFSGLAYVSYLARTFVPIHLVPFQSYPLDAPLWIPVTAVLVMSGLTVVALFRFRSSPWLAAGWLWFVWVILPGSGLVTISDHFAPDRYTYLAHAGLFAALVWEARRLGVRFHIPAKAGWVVLACLAIPLGLLTDRQTRVWKNAETLWTHTLDAKGPNFLALNQLGLVLVKNGRIDEGIRLLEEAVVLKPEIPVAATNLALSLATANRLDDSYRRYQEAGSRLAGRDRIRDGLIREFDAKGRDDLAGLLWKEQIEEDPMNALKRLAAADFFYSAGNETEAYLHYAEAARLDPREVKASLGLGALLIKRGAVDEALPWLEHSVAHARTPEEKADAHRTLAQAHLLGRNWQAAISSYEAGAALAPERELLLNELAQLLLDCPDRTLRNPPRALELAERLETRRNASQAAPNPRFLRTLSRAREQNGRTAEARETAVAGLDAVAALLRQDPLPKPWTREELASLEKWFRENSAKPAR